ncbi:hypothetical protein [Lichenifustis flavocetrariae]|uniref:Uncharacterized protein n=1 Tax=Lichenifustis flavocetrariae TaxID=2949735 RepID=A0AA41Z0M6_9HYPH|nr:hypothetical protein [Lichenifustis flavocetrariae]MCW6512006.1 hypothetical protein [Lichenifustis flavocetrariae]
MVMDTTAESRIHAKGFNMPASDPLRERIEAFNRQRGRGVLVRKAGRGYSLSSEHTGAPLARLKPTGEADTVQVFWWNGQRWGPSGPFGVATMPLDKALEYVASEPIFWINA